MKKRFTEDQIVSILREVTSGGKTVDQVSREYGISPNTYYVWKRKYGAMDEPKIRRLRELEKENSRLKRLLAERDVEIDAMQEIIKNSSCSKGASESGGFFPEAGDFREL